MLGNIEINGHYYQACDGCMELLCKIAALEIKVENFTSTNNARDEIAPQSNNIPSTQCGDCGECGYQSRFSSKCKLGRNNE